MSTIDDILAAARTLDPKDRARLIPLLWDEFGPEGWVAPSTAWIAQANSRSDMVESDQMCTDDWSEARDRARRKAGLPE
jgi:Putative addiction module component